MTEDIDITTLERILKEEEQKEIWKEYAAANIELRDELNKLREKNGPRYSMAVKQTQFNQMLEADRMKRTYPMVNGEVSVWYTLYGSGLGVSLSYMVLIGITLWYHTNYMVP